MSNEQRKECEKSPARETGGGALPHWRAELGLVVVTLLGAFGWIVSSTALQEFPPYTFLGLRFVLAGSVLVVFCWRDMQGLGLRQCLLGVATGMVLAGSLSLWVLALRDTQYVGVGAFIISLNAVAVPIIARILFGHVIGMALVWALLPAVLGLLLLTVENDFVLAQDQWLFVLSMVGFATHLVLTGHFVRQMPSLPLSAIQLLTVGIVGSIIALASENWNHGLSDRAWLLLVAAALLSTSLRFAIQNRVLQQLSASHASVIFLVEPVWTAILSALLLAERMSATQLLGCLLIMSALLVYRKDALRDAWRSRAT